MKTINFVLYKISVKQQKVVLKKNDIIVKQLKNWMLQEIEENLTLFVQLQTTNKDFYIRDFSSFNARVADSFSEVWRFFYFLKRRFC